MKSPCPFICATFLLFTINAVSQTNNMSSGHDLITFINSDLDYIETQREQYAEIEGSAYLNEAFIEGSVSYKGDKISGLELRLNVYEGYFEFQTEKGILIANPKLTQLDTVWIEGDTFIDLTYMSGNEMKRAYMKLMNHSYTRVCILSQIILIQAEPAKGYEEARLATFEKRNDLIFIQFGDKTAIPFKGRKKLNEVFPDHYTQLTEYMKSEKLKLKDPDEILRLCAYYDRIR